MKTISMNRKALSNVYCIVGNNELHYMGIETDCSTNCGNFIALLEFRAKTDECLDRLSINTLVMLSILIR